MQVYRWLGPISIFKLISNLHQKQMTLVSAFSQLGNLVRISNWWLDQIISVVFSNPNDSMKKKKVKNEMGLQAPCSRRWSKSTHSKVQVFKKRKGNITCLDGAFAWALQPSSTGVFSSIFTVNCSVWMLSKYLLNPWAADGGLLGPRTSILSLKPRFPFPSCANTFHQRNQKWLKHAIEIIFLVAKE